MPPESTCASCGAGIPAEARTISFDGDAYCTDCSTRAECGDCGAVGTLPKAVLAGDVAVRCGNCDGVLRTSGE